MSGRTLYVDPIGGAAGDMLLAALIDAGAPVEAVRSAVEATLPGRFQVDTDLVRRGGLRARLLVPGGPEASSALSPRSFEGLLRTLDTAPLPPTVKARARSVMGRLAEAEARVHGTGLTDLHLHELGDADTLLDVVGVSTALDALAANDMLVGPIPLADPGPATLELLRGFTVRSRWSGETVTPTAAAFFAALGTPAERIPDMAVDAIGYGAGSRDTPDRPNVVRVILGIPTSGGVRERDLVVLEANLDDMSPELVADAMQALFAAGALDVWTVPTQMKKGRLGMILSALCDAAAEPGLRRAYFEATSTFGVRAHGVGRFELERQIVTVQLGDGAVRVKIGILHGRVVTAMPEHDDVAELAASGGKPVRLLHEEAVAAAQALRFTHSGGPGP